jgi:hypothetical protein
MASHTHSYLDKALLPTRSSVQRSPTTHDYAEEAAEEALGTSPAALIRRKSLAMPGIATRHSKVEPRMENPEPSMSLHDREWSRDMMLDSPLALLSNLDPLEPPTQIMENRAPTPIGMEYSHLGSLKIGSLVVTNGLASPAPSFVSRDFTFPHRPSIDQRPDDEYFTASEGESTHDGVERPLPPLPPMESRRPSPHAESTLSLEQPQTPERISQAGWPMTKRSGSPLKREIRAESLTYGEQRVNLLVRQPRAAKSAISLTALSENHSLFENTSSDEETKVRHSHQRTKSQSAISLASEYMAELPPSPYGRSKESRELPAAPSQESLEYQRSHEFEDNPVEIDQRGIDEVLELPEAILPPREEISPETALRSHPPSIPILKSALKRKSLVRAKTDSGYSSGSSNRGTAYEDVFYDSEQRHSRDALSSTEAPADAGPELRTTDQRNHTPDYWQTLRQLEAPENRNAILLGTKAIKADEPDREKLERSKSWRKSVRRSLPRILSSGNTPSASSKSSTPESRSESKSDNKGSASKQKKLKKKRPSSQPPLSFGQMRNLADGDVPRVPSDVFSRFSMRLAESPGLEHLEQTYENASSVDSGHGSASSKTAVIGGTIVPASYFPDSNLDSPVGKVKRLSKAIDSGSPPAPQALRYSMQTPRKGNTPFKDGEDEIIGVADFGTVAESLGGSPYDIAVSAKSRRPASTAAQVPHHFSTNQPRFGPRQGWDADTASKFAQMRSKERAAALEEAATETPAERPQMNARHSFHEQRSRAPERRAQSSLLPRPKSSHANGVAGPREIRTQSQPRSTPNTASSAAQSSLSSTHTPVRLTSVTTTTTTPVRPTSTVVTTTTSFQPPRSSTPVKHLVTAFEQKASIIPPSPSAKLAEKCDWSEQSKIWSERRRLALTSTQTSVSRTPNSSTTTTTTVTSFASALRPQPSMSPPARMPNERIPFHHHHSEPLPSPPQELEASGHRARYTPSPTPEPNPIPMEQEPQPQTTFGDEGVFGRYGGGFRHQRDRNLASVVPVGKREMTPRAAMVKKDYGVDLGDVPVAWR